jgi:glutathione S-transferase
MRSNEIPAFVLDDGRAISRDADAIIAYLDRRYGERADPADRQRDANTTRSEVPTGTRFPSGRRERSDGGLQIW